MIQEHNNNNVLWNTTAIEFKFNIIIPDNLWRHVCVSSIKKKLLLFIINIYRTTGARRVQTLLRVDEVITYYYIFFSLKGF